MTDPAPLTPMDRTDEDRAATQRYVNRQRHLCGCITRFDLVCWCSETVHPCSIHARYFPHP